MLSIEKRLLLRDDDWRDSVSRDTSSSATRLDSLVLLRDEVLEAEGSSVSSSSGTGVGVAGGFEGPACASVRRVDRRGCCNGSRDAGLLGGAISAAL